jgi:riboflavin synthase
MFTGIVETVGTIRQVRRERGGATLSVAAALAGERLAIGESIAVSGACLTVEKTTPEGFEAFASAETLSRTTLGGASAGRKVNVERALRADGRLGGHLVLGHVDGRGRVRQAIPSGEARQVAIRAPEEIRRFLAPKGSITVDGVSLTVNAVRSGEFTVMIIPHTAAATTLDGLRPGDEVNLEADVVARYVASLMGGAARPEPDGEGRFS